MPTVEPTQVGPICIELGRPIGTVAPPQTTPTRFLAAECADEMVRILFPVGYHLYQAANMPAPVRLVAPYLRQVTGRPGLLSAPKTASSSAQHTATQQRVVRWTTTLQKACAQQLILKTGVADELHEVNAFLARSRPASMLMRAATSPIAAPAVVGALVVLIVTTVPLLAVTLGAAAGFACWYALRDHDPQPVEGELTFKGSPPQPHKPKLLSQKLKLQLCIYEKLGDHLALAKGPDCSGDLGARSALEAAAKLNAAALDDKQVEIALINQQVSARNKQAPIAGWGAATGTIAVLHTVDNFFGEHLGAVWKSSMALVSSPVIMLTTLLTLDQGVKGFLGTFSSDYQQLLLRLELLRAEEVALKQVAEIYRGLVCDADGWLAKISTRMQLPFFVAGQ